MTRNDRPRLSLHRRSDPFLLSGNYLTHRNPRYYALSAICALLKYAEMKLNTRYAAGSLRIRYVAVEGTVMIDPDTARNLELVNNIAHKKSHHSLFGCVRSHASRHFLLTT
jgi:DNA mismatch repair ATPase MutS